MLCAFAGAPPSCTSAAVGKLVGNAGPASHGPGTVYASACSWLRAAIEASGCGRVAVPPTDAPLLDQLILGL